MDDITTRVLELRNGELEKNRRPNMVILSRHIADTLDIQINFTQSNPIRKKDSYKRLQSGSLYDLEILILENVPHDFLMVVEKTVATND